MNRRMLTEAQGGVAVSVTNRMPVLADQLATAADLSRKARQQRTYARMIRNGTTVYGRTQRGCERSARRLEQIVRNMADAALAQTGSGT